MQLETATELPASTRGDDYFFVQRCRRQPAVPRDEQDGVDCFVLDVENGGVETVGTTTFEVPLQRNGLLSICGEQQLAQNTYVLDVEALSAFGADLAVVTGERFHGRGHRCHEPVKRGLAHRNFQFGQRAIPRLGPIGVVVSLQDASLP